MTTSELIKILKDYEFGAAAGRPRNVYIQVGFEGKIYDSDVIDISTGDGLISELYLTINPEEE